MYDISKVYTTILNTRLLNFYEVNDILSDTQNGFRSKRSCLDHIFVLSSIITNNKANGNDTYTCFIDLKKCFDFLDRNVLHQRSHILGN